MSTRYETLQQQISSFERNLTAPIDKKIHDELLAKAFYEDEFNSEELGNVMAHLLWTYISMGKHIPKILFYRPKILATVYPVKNIINYPDVYMEPIVHITEPINAFVEAEFTLSNSGNGQPNLVLNGNEYSLKCALENQADAKLLQFVNIEEIFGEALRDPNYTVSDTLEYRLKKGFDFRGHLRPAQLTVTPANKLSVRIETR